MGICLENMCISTWYSQACEKCLSNRLKMGHPAGDRVIKGDASGKVSPTLEMTVPMTCHSTHMARWPAPAYLPDAFWRTGHTVVSPSILADGPPELSKCVVLFQGVGTLGSEILVHSRIPDSAIRYFHLFGEVLECPEMQKAVKPGYMLHTAGSKLLRSKLSCGPLSTFFTPDSQ